MDKYRRANRLVHSIAQGQGLALVLWSLATLYLLWGEPRYVFHAVAALVGSIWFVYRMEIHLRDNYHASKKESRAEKAART